MTGENLARFDTQGSGQVLWDHPKPRISIIGWMLQFLRRSK